MAQAREEGRTLLGHQMAHQSRPTSLHELREAITDGALEMAEWWPIGPVHKAQEAPERGLCLERAIDEGSRNAADRCCS